MVREAKAGSALCGASGAVASSAESAKVASCLAAPVWRAGILISSILVARGFVKRPVC